MKSSRPLATDISMALVEAEEESAYVAQSDRPAAVRRDPSHVAEAPLRRVPSDPT